MIDISDSVVEVMATEVLRKLQKPTSHKLIIGDSRSLHELKDESIDLVVTSPPYFNAPHDYKKLFPSYPAFLSMLLAFAKELFRVVKNGRVICINIDDMRVDGTLYPIVADAIKIVESAGFVYTEHIVWRKPNGFIRMTHRSGVAILHPFPSYYYPDNVKESVLVFNKGKRDHLVDENFIREASRLDVNRMNAEKWFFNVWEFANVMPGNKLEKGIAAFPDELPRRLIQLYSFVGDTVLDGYTGSGTTQKVSRQLGRNSIGYEILSQNAAVIREKLGFGELSLDGCTPEDSFEIIDRPLKENPPPYDARSQGSDDVCLQQCFCPFCSRKRHDDIVRKHANTSRPKRSTRSAMRNSIRNPK